MARDLSSSVEKISREEVIEAIDSYGCYTLSGSDLADALKLASARLAARDEVQPVIVAEGTITFEDDNYWLDRNI